eukprot:508140-Amorphochlora_amoeboformis.AAC.3
MYLPSHDFCALEGREKGWDSTSEIGRVAGTFDLFSNPGHDSWYFSGLGGERELYRWFWESGSDIT